MIRVNKTSIVFMLFLALLLFFSFALAQETPLERIKEKILERKQENQPKNSQQLTIPCGGQPVCGNDICEPGENKFNCRKDCGMNPPPYHAERLHKLVYYDSSAKKNIVRTYGLYVPECYSAGMPIPLVLGLHGGGGTGEAVQIQTGGMNKKAEQACFIAVYPDALSSVGIPGKRQYWNAGSRAEFRNQGINDIDFFRALIDKLAGDYSIDKKRIYATGISNGAMMSYCLACKLSDKIAAIAPVAGEMVLENCQPEQPVSVIHFHGTADPAVPYNGGRGRFTKDTFAPVSDSINKWFGFDNCHNTPMVTYQNGEVTCRTYASCKNGTEITFCTIENGGHTFPGGYTFPIERPFVGKVTKDISFLDAMWDFFQKHPKQ